MGLKQLKGRSLEICSGCSDLDWNTVSAYRAMFAEQGYELPPWPEAGTAISPRKVCSTVGRGKYTECSDVGTLLTAAVEAATSQPLSCDHCAAYILSLASAAVLDSDEITTTIIGLLGDGQDTRPMLQGLHCRLLECIQSALLLLIDAE